jgi:hypothetical protein
MVENNASGARKKIIDLLKVRGPSLPVQLAREAGISSIFVGAFLSELAREDKLKISSMKVGGSPLYFLKGQEEKLENFYKYLPGKEKEAFNLLKDNKILRDREQEPAIRVALRNLKDFAIPFRDNEEIFWKFHSISNEQVREIFEGKPKKMPAKQQEKKLGKQEQEQEVEKEKTEEKQEKKQKQEEKEDKQQDEEEKEEKQNQRQLLKIEKQKQEKKKKTKEKPKFVDEIVSFFDERNIQVLEEIEIKKKEYTCKIRANSTLGKIDFFCVAKDKKRITESDLRLIFQKAQNMKLPALVIYPKNMSKKAESYAEDCGSLLILKKLDRY